MHIIYVFVCLNVYVCVGICRYACIMHIVHYLHMYVTILYVICMYIVQIIFVRIQSKIEPTVKYIYCLL